MTTADESYLILLIEDNPLDARLVRAVIERTGRAAGDGARAARFVFEVLVADSLSAAEAYLARGDIDLILLDLTLPDSIGLHSLARLRAVAEEVPVVVLTGDDDEATGMEALRGGAQDFLVKGRLDYELLSRTLRYSMERHRLHLRLRQISILDELTGLYNRRGFLTHAQQAMKLAVRNGRGLVLAYVDLDGMKHINDTYGHAEGDRALVATAQVLRDAFRASDVIARLGGDEFTALLLEASPEDTEVIAERLRQKLDAFNASGTLRYHLSFSVGLAGAPGSAPPTLEQLMSRADAALYERKRLASRRR